MTELEKKQNGEYPMNMCGQVSNVVNQTKKRAQAVKNDLQVSNVGNWLELQCHSVHQRIAWNMTMTCLLDIQQAVGGTVLNLRSEVQRGNTGLSPQNHDERQ